MAEKQKTEPQAPEESVVSTPTSADSPVAQSIQLPPITAQPGALIGDENQAPVRKLDVQVNSGEVPAPPSPAAPAGTPTTAPVHEVHIELGGTILDPSSPEAVQIPDAGRGTLDLPIHALSGPTPEDVFAGKA